MQALQIPTNIPESLYLFFWDIDAPKLDPSQHPKYVINRLLDKGNLEGVRWVLRNFPRDAITDTIKNMRDFSPRSSRFWAKYYNIPEKEVRCLQPSYLTMRRMHWPY